MAEGIETVEDLIESINQSEDGIIGDGKGTDKTEKG